MDSSASALKTGQANARHGHRERFLQIQNHNEIESIARDLGRPFLEIDALYADIFALLKSRAQVTDYLPIFVARTVRLLYQNKVSH
jgi:hypothetical protein